MRILITGAGGFIGSHLADYLSNNGHEVYGTYYRKKCELKNVIEIKTDLTNRQNVKKVVQISKPEIIFHLAGQTLIMPSWKNPEQTIKTNIFSTLFLLEEVSAATKIIIFGSSSEYSSRSRKKVKETDTLNPSNPYALSKLIQGYLAKIYEKKNKIKTIIIRPFSIIGPGKELDVCSDLAKRFIELERKGKNELSIGDTNIVRDFLDINDAVSGIWQIAKKGTPGEIYNLCSGEGVTIKQLIQIYTEISRMKIKIKIDQKLFRPVDEQYKVGDNSKIKALGWKRQVTLSASLSKIIKYWRNK